MTIAITPIGLRVVRSSDIARMLERCGKYDPDVTIPMAYQLLSYKEPLPCRQEIVYDLALIVTRKRGGETQRWMFITDEAEAIAKKIVYGTEDEV